MKKTKYLTELRELTLPKLIERRSSLEESLFKFRCNLVIGLVSDNQSIKKTKQNLARTNTILNEKMKNGTE